MENICSHKNLCMPVHSSMVHNSQESGNNLTDGRINMWYIHIMEYHTKRNEVITGVITGIYIVNMLSKRNWAQKTTNYIISCIQIV